MKITSYQKRILFELAMGGKIFKFADNGQYRYGFDDVDQNSYAFKSTTFEIMLKNDLIQSVQHPSIDVHIYGLTKKAENFLATTKSI